MNDLRVARRSPTWRTISFRSRACQSASQCAAYCPPHHSAALEAGSVPCARGVCWRVEEWKSGRVEGTSLNSQEIDMNHEMRDRTACAIRHASRVEKLPAIKSSSEQRPHVTTKVITPAGVITRSRGATSPRGVLSHTTHEFTSRERTPTARRPTS